MVISTGELNRATLARQLLLCRAQMSAVEAVRRVVALQAQELASPYVALWNRLEGFDGADLDRAFAEREVVKATVMRITLHAVTAEDYPAFHAAMLPYLRASRLSDRRFTSEGLTADAADALLPALLDLLAEPRTKAAVEALCGSPRMWWALRTFAPLLHAPIGPPWSFGSPRSTLPRRRRSSSPPLTATSMPVERTSCAATSRASVPHRRPISAPSRCCASPRFVRPSRTSATRSYTSKGPTGSNCSTFPAA